MGKTLMILGAGYGQLPAIQKTKQRGYKVIATSYDFKMRKRKSLIFLPSALKH